LKGWTRYAVVRIPTNKKDLTEFAKRTVEDCRVSQTQRAAAYRQFGAWTETGRAQGGGLALANLLYSHTDRLAAHLFSPSELRFAIDFENLYPKDWLEKGVVAARVVSREWERNNIDMLFGHGVKESLTYASCLLKQLGGKDANGNFYMRGARLVMPWQFGVYNESVNDLRDQEAFVETVWLTRHEVWRRVRNLPDAETLYKKILANAAKEESVGAPTSFMHQVLSTAVLNTNNPPITQTQPGGLVSLTNDANFSPLGPLVAAELYPMHELWVRDDSRSGEDYTTIQLFEPDVLVAPLLKHANLFVPESQPYTLIQANYVPGYFWGRSEITDLMMLQSWLSEHLDDAKRLMGLQIDKIFGFEGIEGLSDEIYAQMTKVPGTVSVGQGVKIHDLTPKLPDQLLPLIAEIIQLMNMVSGFPPIMAGQGEPGVRAGVHADTLMKTGSPRLRDRSLLVERQCASAADTTLAMLEAKDAKAYWTQPGKEDTEFLLSQLPDDRRIAVDSHSGSPIYADDHAQLLAWGVQRGIVTKKGAIEQMAFAHKDKLIQELEQQEAAQRAFMLEHPEFFAKPGGRARKQLAN
jgi:hypothetical protein